MENLAAFLQDLPSRINPNLFEAGPLQVRYYSLMYLVAFGLTYILAIYRIRKENFKYSTEIIQDLFMWGILGLIIGARLWYAIFYNFSYYISHPLEIILPFEFSGGIRFVGISGMSFHGGAIGLLLAGLIYCRRRHVSFWNLSELFAPIMPLGYTFGRIGNFINGELYGRAADVPWGMVFPLDPTGLIRHPSQLYEAFFEGIVLFVILWSIRRKSPFDGFLLAMYLIGYGAFRFFLEFFREPDMQLGFIFAGLSMGQMQCIGMILAGFMIYLWRKRQAT
ncbi:MAG: prolipoprotein diacylglyceryl transferase [Deltaproteobacteria bacterium]|nr:prolipoprotein diacylglyceryl transferase [Deltaproteobacteria bacterium]